MEERATKSGKKLFGLNKKKKPEEKKRADFTDSDAESSRGKKRNERGNDQRDYQSNGKENVYADTLQGKPVLEKQRTAKTDEKMEQLGQELKTKRMDDVKPGPSNPGQGPSRSNNPGAGSGASGSSKQGSHDQDATCTCCKSIWGKKRNERRNDQRDYQSNEKDNVNSDTLQGQPVLEEQRSAKTDEKMEQLGQELKTKRMDDVQPGPSNPGQGPSRSNNPGARSEASSSSKQGSHNQVPDPRNGGRVPSEDGYKSTEPSQSEKERNFTGPAAEPAGENRRNKNQRGEKDNVNSDLNSHVNVGAGASIYASSSNNEQINSQVNSKFSGYHGAETGSRPPEEIKPESLVKDTIACNINIMDNLALLLDKASFIRNREVPLTKNWVNLAEYFEVCEEVKLRCQQSSPNSPAKNLFEFLRTISISVKKVTDCLREIGRTDLANMMETLCLPGNTELRNLFDNPKQSKILDKICLHLDGGGIGNWQDLGKEIGIQVKELTNAKMLQFAKETHGCTKTVLEVIEKKFHPEVTIKEIKEVLTDLSREDVLPALESFSDNEGISKLLNDFDAMEKITTLLDNETPGVNSWPQFAQKFDLTRKECDALRPDGLLSPTKELITHLIQVTPGLTVKEFIAAIENIGRLNDVTKVLEEFFKAQCVEKIVLVVKTEMKTTM